MQQAIFIDHPTVMDRIKKEIEDLLEPREYQRLQRPLEIIERDRKIRSRFKQLRRQGYKVHQAIREIATQPWCGQYLSEDWIEEIIYPRNRKTKEAP